MDVFTDALLIKALKAGDINALERVYKGYYPKLLTFIKKFKLTSLEPEDFIQETFAIVWERRNELKDDILFDKQIYVIARNLVLNHIKREKKLLSADEEVLNKIQVWEKHEVSDEKKLIKIRGLIERMPPKRKEIFKLHKIENLTYKEIADYLHISPKTIAQQIYLATIFLKDEIKK